MRSRRENLKPPLQDETEKSMVAIKYARYSADHNNQKLVERQRKKAFMHATLICVKVVDLEVDRRTRVEEKHERA